MIEVFEAFGWTLLLGCLAVAVLFITALDKKTVIIAFDAPVESVLQIIVPEIYHLIGLHIKQ